MSMSYLTLVLSVCLLAQGYANVLPGVQKTSGKAPWMKMNDGQEIPSFGLGTWLGFNSGDAKPEELEQAVSDAIDAGYRHIDTASIYDTEEAVGKAVNKKIKEGVVTRDDLFITTKLWNDRHPRDDVVPALRESLQKLNLDYVDLYLIHWPVSYYKNMTRANIDPAETWQGMIEAKELNLTKSIGISNFNVTQMEDLMKKSQVKPAVLQTEINLNLQRPGILDYCRQQDIRVTGYTPFGSLFPNKADKKAPPPRVDHPVMVAMATKYNKTVPQIALKYLLDTLHVIPIPKSAKKERIGQNIDIFDFKLDDGDNEILKKFDANYRTIVVADW